MLTPFEKKIAAVKERFSACKTQEEIYQTIIALGRSLSPLSEEERHEENLVAGCQSTVYLVASFSQGKIHFTAEADALISGGLAYILTSVYSGEAPELLLQQPPTYLEELGIPSALTPSRANGLASIHLRMKQRALEALVAS